MNSKITDLDLPQDGVVNTQLTYETLKKHIQTYRFNFSVTAVCLEGKATVIVNTTEYELCPSDMITLFTGALIEIKEVSNDARFSSVCFSPEVVNRVNPLKVSGDLFHIIIDKPVLPLKKESMAYFKDYFSLIERVEYDGAVESCMDLAVSFYNSILVATQLVYKSHTTKSKQTTRKEEICSELIELISKNYISDRRAQFYADKLGISLQHLSTTVKTVTGKNVLDIIAYVVIMDAKGKLKSTNMTIQEVAYSLNFPSASFFGKYFRRYVGLTPLEYRKS